MLSKDEYRASLLTGVVEEHVDLEPARNICCKDIWE